MNQSLDILNNPNEIFENDFCIINLWTEHITWKPAKFNPKMEKMIHYWLDEKRINKNKVSEYVSIFHYYNK
jgi:hypothetical protein